MLTGLQAKRTLVKTAAEAYRVLSSPPLLNDESHSRNRQPPVPSRNCIDLKLGVRQRSCLERDLPGVAAFEKRDVKMLFKLRWEGKTTNNIPYHGL